MATVPTGYVFWDVSANKSYAAGKTFPTLGNGDYLVPATSSYDGYYQQYTYYTSYTDAGSGLKWTNCWVGVVQAAYDAKPQKLPFNSIADKPVRCFSYQGAQITACPTTTNAGGTSSISAITNLQQVSFYDCTKLATAPALPTSIKSLHMAFYNTKITSPPSNFASLTNLIEAEYCFWNCTSLTSAPTISGLSALARATGMFYKCTNLVTPPVLPPNVLDIGYMFYGCTKLTSGPTIPSQVTSMYGTFWGCTSLVGNIRIESANISNTGNAFKNTSASKQIILLGPSGVWSKLTALAKTGNNGNVYAGIIATPKSFKAIRGTYDSTNQTFTEVANGQYCKLTVNYSAPYVSGALLIPPTLTSGEDTLNPTWYISTLGGTVLTSAGTQAQATGTIVCVIDLGSGETAASFDLKMRTQYTYNSIAYAWNSGTVAAFLTYSNAIIDVNPTGTGMAFFGEAPDDYVGLIVNSDVTAEDLYLEIDMNAASGDDYEIRTALTALGWTDCLVD